MTDAISASVGANDAAKLWLKRRYAAERRFRVYGMAAIGAALLALAVLLTSIVTPGIGALWAHELTLEVHLDEARIDPQGGRDQETLRRANYNGLLQTALRERFPHVAGRSDLRELFGLYTSINAAALQDRVAADPALIGQTITFSMPISDDADLYLQGDLTDETAQIVNAAARLETAGDNIVVSADADVFAGAVANAKAALIVEAGRLDARAGVIERQAVGLEGEARTAQLSEAVRLRNQATEFRSTGASADGEVTLDENAPSILIAVHGGYIKAERLTASEATGQTLIPLTAADAAGPGTWRALHFATPETNRRVSDLQIAHIKALEADGAVKRVFNHYLFTRADSREPELAGVLGAVVGSTLVLFVTMLLAVPIGVSAAIYLEEFAPKNRITDFIEVNINNLAAVPSIVFGLLGLAVFINFFGLPRSAPVVGGMVLALMTLPTVIISSRAAIKAVPPSIREAALGVGASKHQAVFHHVLPLALPGIMTGSIIGLAQALGETAPLLMIGMVAFVADIPSGFTSPATVMPVQVYLWADSAERAFASRTAAAIMVLLALMVVMNLAAIYMRHKFERRW